MNMLRRIRFIVLFAAVMFYSVSGWSQVAVGATPVTSTEGYEFFVTWLLNGNRGPKDKDLKLQLMINSRAVEGHPEITTNDVRIEVNGKSVDVSVPVNETTVLTLGEGAASAITLPDVFIDPEKTEEEKVSDKGVHVYSKNGVKMTVYAGNKIGMDIGSTSFDASHVLPKEALGFEYVVTCNANDINATEFVIMSTVNGETNVKVTLPDNVKTSTGKAGTLDNIKFTKQNQIYVVRSQTIDPSQQSEELLSSIDLSGSLICSSQPIAVWSGNHAAYYPSTLSGSTDHAVDQLLPVNHWGTEFVIPMLKYDATPFTMAHMLITALEGGTTVTVKHGSASETLTFTKAGETQDVKMDGSGTDANNVYVVASTDSKKKIQVYLHTPTAAANIGTDSQGNMLTPGDASMTMIPPTQFMTDTTIFSTYTPPGLPTTSVMEHKMVIWARKSDAGSIRWNGNTIPFVNMGANNNYQFAVVNIDQPDPATPTTHIITAPKKCFSGYAYGLANGQAYLYPIGYDYLPQRDSLFLGDKTKAYDGKVHTSEWSNKAPEGGGWPLDKIELPNLPTQYDTVFVCDSTKLRFPALIKNHWDDLKWEIYRIDFKSKKPSKEYLEDADVRQTGDLTKPIPFLETAFYMLPEKELAPNKRHPYEDFEVRAILFHKPVLCEDENEENWPKDTLNAIVRAFRSYNDTTWLIRCDNDPAINKFFIDPETKNPQRIICAPNDNTTSGCTDKLVYGGDGADGRKGTKNTFREDYLTRYSDIVQCDSIVVLKVLLCKSEVTVRPPDYICEKDLATITSSFGGDFFKDFNLLGTYEECKKSVTVRNLDEKKDFGNGWIYYGDTGGTLARSWQYKGTDVIRTTDCNPDMQEWHDKFGAGWPNNRATIGCDRSLTIELHVMPTVEYEESYVCCGDKYVWKYKENRLNNPKDADPVTILRKDYGFGNHTIERYFTPRSARPGWSTNCETEKYILHLTFTDGTVTQDIDLCDDGAEFVVSKAKYADIEDETTSWTFDPKGKYGVTNSPSFRCVTADDCVYDLNFRINVHQVERHNDTIVYCFEDGSTFIHKWDGHRKPYVQEQGKPATKKRYDDASNPFKPKRDKNNKIVYELSDTLTVDPCHVVYSQTVIMMPEYYTSDKHDAISTEEYFEWEGIIWAGEDVRTSSISAGGKPIVVLKEYGRTVPDDYTVEYVKGDSLYVITTTTDTKAYHRENGMLTDVCDSTVQLSVQVAHVQRETTYWYACSKSCKDDRPYTWYAGGVTPITINFADFEGNDYTNITEPVTIHDSRHDLLTTTAKRVDPNDPKKGQPSYGVEGIKAEFDHYVTIFPAYVTSYDSSACQSPGETIVFRDIPFILDDYGPKDFFNSDKVLSYTWTHPITGETKNDIPCSDCEKVVLHVEPIYNEVYNRSMATEQIVMYTHDTLRYFTDPAVLFVGEDFFMTHPHVADMEALKALAGVDSAILVDYHLVPELGDPTIDWSLHRARYDSKQEMKDGSRVLNTGTGEPMGCDSTSFLELYLVKPIIMDPAIMGDNGHYISTIDDTGNSIPVENGEKWSFGGDTLHSVSGTQTHTHPFLNGDYFQYYYDENGNIIESVPFDEEDATKRDQNVGKDKNFDVTVNEDGTRTYLLMDSAFNTMTGRYDVYIQSVTVYPTYVINYFKSKAYIESGGEPRDELVVCANDIISCPWRPEKKISVRELPRDDNRNAIIADTLCVERFKNEYGGLCVDSIIYMKLKVYGNAHAPYTHNHCFNDPPYYWKDIPGNPDYSLPPVVYDPEQIISGPIYDTIKPEDPNITCVDVLVFNVQFNPAYGISDYGDEGRYIKPFIYEDTICQYVKYHWVLNDGKSEHKLYDQNGNRIFADTVPTDQVGEFTVYDSLKTKGCQCDSVLTLNYVVMKAEAATDTTITACENEVVHFTVPKYHCQQDILIDRELINDPHLTIRCSNPPNCDKEFNISFEIFELTRFYDVKAEPICYGPSNPFGAFAVSFRFRGEYPPVSYSIFFSQEAKDSLRIRNDIIDKAVSPIIDMNEWDPEKVYEVIVSLPEVVAKEDYPTPGIYDAVIGFNNGHCASVEYMSYPIKLDVRYPDWLMEQRHGDLIVLLDSVDNGHRKFSGFQWYKEGRMMEGYTQPYLYVPGGLDVGASYYVIITETNAEGDTVTVSPTCPIIAVEAPNGGDVGNIDHGPTSDYISVTPTCVPLGRTTIYIVSDENNAGTYRVTTIEGQQVSTGDFSGPATPITIPAVEGMYVVQIKSAKGVVEPYRAIKVVVGNVCQ